jgi:hypothetical protein
VSCLECCWWKLSIDIHFLPGRRLVLDLNRYVKPNWCQRGQTSPVYKQWRFVRGLRWRILGICLLELPVSYWLRWPVNRDDISRRRNGSINWGSREISNVRMSLVSVFVIYCCWDVAFGIQRGNLPKGCYHKWCYSIWHNRWNGREVWSGYGSTTSGILIFIRIPRCRVGPEYH